MAESDIKQDAPAEAPAEEIQVQIEGDAPAEAKPEQAAEDAGDGEGPKRKPRINPSTRINQLTAQKAAVEREAEAQRQRFAEELAAARASSQEAIEAALHYGKQALERDLELAKRDLKLAKDSGDTEAESALTVKISGIQAQISRIPAPSQAQQAQPQYEQPRQQARQAPPPDVLPPVEAPNGQKTPFGAWVENNSWFDQGSPDFDPVLHETARDFADTYERQLTRLGRANEIGTPAYFQQISNYMNSQFPSEEAPRQEQRQAPRMPPMSGQSPAAPASRGVPQGRSNNIVSLSKDQEEYALIHYNNRKHPDGRPYSRDDKLKAYAMLLKNPSAGPVNISIVNKDNRV